MAKDTSKNCCEQFKTVIGGQALIEGIMMRGPEKDSVVVRGKDGLSVEVMRRKLPAEKSPLRWPLIRGVYNFFDSQVTGVKSLMRSADLSPEEGEVDAESSKLDQWLEKKLGDEKFQQYLIGISVALGMGLSIVLFFLLPMVVASFLDRWIPSTLGLNLVEGAVRICIFKAYIILISRMKEMKRLFAYHGAEHKTIRCYEAGLPLTVENDPAPSPRRDQFFAGRHDPLHSGVLCGFFFAACLYSGPGCHKRHYRVQADHDRVQAAASAAGRFHCL